MALASLYLSIPARVAASDDFGSLVARFEHAEWPSPESVLNDLRSKNDDVRFNALRLVGLPVSNARLPIWSATQPSVAIGSRVVSVERVALQYAALGSDAAQQAILVVQVEGQLAFAAVATPTANGWERIGAFDYWCKYDPYAINTFASIVRAPDPPAFPDGGPYELVLRSSGGGSGMYEQHEVHFRLYRREMKSVISFVSRIKNIPYGVPGSPLLRIERRWLLPSVPLSPGGSTFVSLLVEGTAETPVPPDINFIIPELQDRYLGKVTCRTLKWNETAFRYESASVKNPCEAPASAP